MAFECTIPILRVQDIKASIDFYTQVLGFSVDWGSDGIVASVSRDGCPLMLCQGDQGHAGTWVWIGVDDAQAQYDEFMDKGATFRIPPTNYAWAYEMQVVDPDGHILRFGSEPKTDRPFETWR